MDPNKLIWQKQQWEGATTKGKNGVAIVGEKGWRNLFWKHGRDFGTERVGGKKLKTETE